MADRKRGRSADDEVPEEVSDEAVEDSDDDELTDDELADDDEFDDDADAEFDDEEFDDEPEDDDADERKPARTRGRSAVATRTRPRTREATKRGPLRRLVAYVRNFVREVVAELQKVIWPTRKELLTYTAVVVVFVSLLMAIVAGLDVGFARVMFIVFGRPDQ